LLRGGREVAIGRASECALGGRTASRLFSAAAARPRRHRLWQRRAISRSLVHRAHNLARWRVGRATRPQCAGCMLQRLLNGSNEGGSGPHPSTKNAAHAARSSGRLAKICIKVRHLVRTGDSTSRTQHSQSSLRICNCRSALTHCSFSAWPNQGGSEQKYILPVCK